MTERKDAIEALVEFHEALDGLIDTYKNRIEEIIEGIVPDGLSMDECSDIQLVRRLAMELEDESRSIAHGLE